MDTPLHLYLKDEPGRATRLAREINRSVSFVGHMAKGRRPVPLGIVHAVSRATGLSLKELRDDWKTIWPDLDNTASAPRRATEGATA
jgi:DNA-binding transcriptional regulator YdaS (Cro superfamily)